MSNKINCRNRQVLRLVERINMKFVDWLVFTSIGIVAAITIHGITCGFSAAAVLKPGQKWVSVEDNPFIEPQTNTIIEIKSGWILYHNQTNLTNYSKVIKFLSLHNKVD